MNEVAGYSEVAPTSIRRTSDVGPVPVVPYSNYKTDTSLKRTVGAGPDGVRFRES